MQKRASIELSQSAFNFNIENIKKAGGSAAVAIVVKGNAYGHGMKEIAQMAQDNPTVSWICTAGLGEALQLRAWGITKPLLVLSYLDADLEQAIAYDIHLMISHISEALALNYAAQQVGKKAYVHIKIDTGMSRLGVQPEEAHLFIEALQKLTHLELYGLATHLCDTPNPDQTFSILQLKTFDAVQEIIESTGINFQALHAQSSSALCLKPTGKYTLLRAGAAAYGIWKSEEHKHKLQTIHPGFDLRPVMQWRTRIIQIKHIPAGATVGYDNTFKAQRPTVIAIAPIGYWDGYSRGLSNRGIAVINNQHAPIAGIVSMNMTAFDVTDLPAVSLHDEIILMGDIPGITAHECARSAGIITNEMITHINSSIERTVVAAHKHTGITAHIDTNAGARPPLYAQSQT